MAGFEWAKDLSGAGPQKVKIVSADAALAVGDLVNLESGQADLAVSNDSALYGIVDGTVDPDGDITDMTAGTTEIYVILLTPTVVMRAVDANARAIGDPLDFTGGTGAMAIAANSDTDLMVVATSTATEATLVKVAPGETWMD